MLTGCRQSIPYTGATNGHRDILGTMAITLAYSQCRQGEVDLAEVTTSRLRRCILLMLRNFRRLLRPGLWRPEVSLGLIYPHYNHVFRSSIPDLVRHLSSHRQ